ncbi:MAG: T9SS type A sorting domain-containing protein [candidate division WOR-3 bacterium]|nr:T9SS type A sorting domain-containing protein [candidate division WOR-3 bacterium]
MKVYHPDYFIDQISYAETLYSPILAPPSGASAARFIFSLVSNNYPRKLIDWYIDYSPTLGSENNDYPGCVLKGYVYLNSVPFPDAKIVVRTIDSILTPWSFYKTCSTFTNLHGFYYIDSLWPVRYWTTVSLGNLPPTGELSPSLCALWEKNLNFYIVSTTEKVVGSLLKDAHLTVFPNPFKNKLEIRCLIQDAVKVKQDFNLAIFDVSGRVVKSLNLITQNQTSTFFWYGTDGNGLSLPAGIYCVNLITWDSTKTENVVLLR